MLRATSASLYILALFCLCTPTLQAQSTEADIKARLIDKPLYLRGLYSEDKLKFDATGHLINHSGTASFTVCGINIYKVQLEQKKLVLEGTRMGLELGPGTQRIVVLKVGRKSDEEEPVHIEIASSADYGPTLDAIFADGLFNLTPSLPDYWQKYAHENFLPANTTLAATPVSTTQTSASDPNEQPHKVGGSVAPPKLLTSPEPQFTQAARHLKYNGTTLINLIVKKDGLPTGLSIVRPMGLGLDDAAIAAVSRYTFRPASQDGSPVAVTLNIEVNFQIY